MYSVIRRIVGEDRVQGSIHWSAAGPIDRDFDVRLRPGGCFSLGTGSGKIKYRLKSL